MQQFGWQLFQVDLSTGVTGESEGGVVSPLINQLDLPQVCSAAQRQCKASKNLVNVA